MIFNAADYLKDRKRFKPQEHTVEGVEFNLIPLSDDMIQEFKIDNEPYDDMLVYAANRGVSIGRVRVFDDDDMAEDLGDMWTLEQFAECEPTLIHQVGLIVFEISGLSEYVEDQRKLEEEIKAEELKAEEKKKAEAAKGDSTLECGEYDIPEATDLNNMSPEQMAQHHKANAA